MNMNEGCFCYIHVTYKFVYPKNNFSLQKYVIIFNKVIFELFQNILLLIRPTCITIDFFNGNICIASMITGDTPKSTMWTSN